VEHRRLPQNVDKERDHNNIFSYLYRSLHWSVLLPTLVIDQSLRWNSHRLTVESCARVDAIIVGSPLLIVETAIRNG
jgi:hypothetical protein